MTTPINLGQPSLPLSQSIVVQGPFPSFSGSVYGSDSTFMGFIYQTAFDPSNVQTLMQADGQTLNVNGNDPLYALLSNTYGGEGLANFRLPDLQGAAPIFLRPNTGPTLWGTKQGSPDNSVSLLQDQLPFSLGGESEPIANQQYGRGIQYVIQAYGIYPVGDATPSTMGMVYPYAATFRGGVPDEFLPADGRLLAINENVVLYSILGTTGRVTHTRRARGQCCAVRRGATTSQWKNSDERSKFCG